MDHEGIHYLKCAGLIKRVAITLLFSRHMEGTVLILETNVLIWYRVHAMMILGVFSGYGDVTH